MPALMNAVKAYVVLCHHAFHAVCPFIGANLRKLKPAKSACCAFVAANQIMQSKFLKKILHQRIIPRT